MNLKQDEALAFLNKFKGSSVAANLRVRSALPNDRSLGVVRFDCKAILASCDCEGVSLTWSDGRMYIQMEGALFSYPDAEQTAPVGIEIMLADGVKCVICPVR
jgi:hypothetical protein